MQPATDLYELIAGPSLGFSCDKLNLPQSTDVRMDRRSVFVVGTPDIGWKAVIGRFETSLAPYHCGATTRCSDQCNHGDDQGRKRDPQYHVPTICRE